MKEKLRKLSTWSHLPWLLLFSLALIWGSSFILIKRGLEVFSPEQVGLLRVSLAGIGLLIFGYPQLRKIDTASWRIILLSGVLGSFLPSYFFALAQTNLSSSLTGILNALTPICAVLAGMIFFAQIPKRNQFLGIFLGLLGAVWLTLIKEDGSLGTLNAYVFLVFLATLCYGINSNIIKSKLGHIAPFPLAVASFAVILPLGLLGLLMTDFTAQMQLQGAWKALGYISILAWVGTGFALVLFNKLIQLTDAVFATTVTYLIPIVAILWGINDAEAFGIAQLVGMLLIITGVYLSNRKKKK
ncbi:MAG: DMT family transporter [Bernardetiaceae bacterium]|nr:DMT family transporter [Bernardetiaceae bacterium]